MNPILGWLKIVVLSKLLLRRVSKFTSEFDYFLPRGWGVLTLPPSIFKKASTPQWALGLLDLDKAVSMDFNEIRHPKFLDITASVRQIGSLDPPVSTGTGWGEDFEHMAESVLTNDDESDAEQHHGTEETPPSSLPAGQRVLEGASNLRIGTLVKRVVESIEPLSKESFQDSSKRRWIQEQIMAEAVKIMHNMDPKALEAWRNEGFLTLHTQQVAQEVEKMKQATVAFSLLVKTPQKLQAAINRTSDLQTQLNDPNTRHALNIEPSLANIPTTNRSHVFLLPDASAILRTYKQDIELLPPNPSTLPTICTRLLSQRLTAAAAAVAAPLRPFDRLNMLAVIPDLSLIIIGSQAGRCALITPTRLRDDLSNDGPSVMMRIETFLPTKGQEAQGWRPSVPLLGLGVAPVWTGGGGDDSGTTRRGGSRGRAWRLILHYYDETVLSWEISRDESDLLLVGKGDNGVVPMI